MMPALVAVSLCGVLIALPDAQAQASETCVKEARDRGGPGLAVDAVAGGVQRAAGAALNKGDAQWRQRRSRASPFRILVCSPGQQGT